jgi:5-amino-6-(5-phosphoribosylamino)uracil reductase
VRSVLCEGGPRLLSALLHDGALDELFVTIAPKLAGGGDGPPMTTGLELPELFELDLVWALEHASALYLRYAARRSARAIA